MIDDKFLDSWKDSRVVFEKQLELNLKQLQGDYPRHWVVSLDFLNKIEWNSILDISCGVGSLYRLVNDNFKDKKYTGIDYSEIALDIAKKQWNYDKFYLKDINELTPNYTKEFDVIYASGIIDIIPDEYLIDRLLKLNNKYAIFSRIHIVSNKSYLNTYQAYEQITTYKFHLNQKLFDSFIKNNNYTLIDSNDENYLLKRNI